MGARTRQSLVLFTALVLLARVDVAFGAAGDAPAPAPKAAAPAASACVAKLSAAASQCSACLNSANKVAYTRLDRVFGMRRNSAFRLDLNRFFRLAVTFSQDTVKAPEPCCKAAAEVFTQSFQSSCACAAEVTEHTKYFDKELMDYYYEFLSSSCGWDADAFTPWRSCGFGASSFTYSAQENAFKIPDWVDSIVGAGKGIAKAATTAATGAVSAAAGAATGAAGAAAGAMSGAANAAAGAMSGVGGLVGGVAGGAGGALGAVPLIGKRRLQEGQCSIAGPSKRVAQNNASVPFYFLCPASTGHCAAGKCVFGRTAAVGKDQWASCAPLAGCGDDGAAPGGGAKGGGGGKSGCFPGAAAARLEGGGSRRMDELRVGDRVLAISKTGDLEYQDVYFFGHRDSEAEAAFVRLELAGGAAFELTPDHFVHVLPPSAGADGVSVQLALSRARMAYAGDVRPGDAVLALPSADSAGGAGAGLRVSKVLRASTVSRRGLYNPYTMGGSIVVDGVLASAHSAWLVDDVFAAAGASHRLPAFFQGLFAPLRVAYRLAGPGFMQRFGDALARAALRLEGAVAASGGLGAAPAAAATTAAALAAGAAVAAKRARAH